MIVAGAMINSKAMSAKKTGTARATALTVEAVHRVCGRFYRIPGDGSPGA
jgi:hypothetical protein